MLLKLKTSISYLIAFLFPICYVDIINVASDVDELDYKLRRRTGFEK